MKLKKYLLEKKKNPETIPDFLFSIERFNFGKFNYNSHSIIKNICQNQNLNYKVGIQKNQTEIKDLKIFMS